MRYVSSLVLFFLINPLMAEEAITFKKELVTSTHWLSYGLVLLVLISFLFLFAKNTKKVLGTSTQLKVLERIAIHHKTRVYVLDYQGQQFLLADNQNSVTIQALHETNTDDK